jgi:propanol-preferring alcohol dehydrogenase
VLELTAGEGAEAVLDFVGKDETLAIAARMVKRSGILALLGLFGGTVPFGFYAAAPEVVFTTVYAGTRTDLDEVVALARARRIRLLPITSYPLDQANKALEDLRGGRITYRAVLEPR